MGIIRWIGAYLTDREQFVDAQNCSSGARPVSSGVPQGSVLGPLLFLIYVNDIIDVIPANVSIRLYADDSVIYKEIVSHDDHEELQRCLVAISEWCLNWGMQLNAEKTVLLRVTRKKSPSEFHYQLENRTVAEVCKYKYLGVTLTNKHGKHIFQISAQPP